MVDLFRTKHWDLVGKRNWWFALSLLIIIPGLVALCTRGLNLGIDFTGGGMITYQMEQPLRGSQAEQAAALAARIRKETGVEVRVQFAREPTGRDQILVRTRVPKTTAGNEGRILEDQTRAISKVMEAAYPGSRHGSAEMISPVVSGELVRNAIWSVALGCIFILTWIRIRYFDFKWAFSGVVALVHDVLVLLGVFALTGWEVNSPFVAAALTVVGFSVHDTIIIYDRIRENLKLRKGATFAETTNISLLETLARSVNTVLTVEFVLIAVAVFGGATLREFTYAMIVGVTTGAYSSIFNASQLLVVFKNREERALAARRAAQTATRSAKARPSQAAPRPQVETPRPAPTLPESQPALRAAAGDEAGEPVRNAGERTQTTARKKLKATGKRKRRF